jgi:catechol 2,3-dioxygenase-like lactoylglutathione lyase family enzyme
MANDLFKDTEAFSGFAVDDLTKARDFYGGTLGLRISDDAGMPGLLTLRLGSGHRVLVYEKADFSPASYTILNFAVGDVGAAAAELTRLGVRLERYPGFPQDEDGVMRGNGPDIAWFTDPAGNVLSVVQRTP